jgi:hypothetical protein
MLCVVGIALNALRRWNCAKNTFWYESLNSNRQLRSQLPIDEQGGTGKF